MNMLKSKNIISRIFNNKNWLISTALLVLASITIYHLYPFNHDGALYISAVKRFDFDGFGGHIVYFYVNWAFYKVLNIFHIAAHQSLTISSLLIAFFTIYFTSQALRLKRISLPTPLLTLVFLSSPIFVYFLQEFDVLMLAGLWLILSILSFELGYKKQSSFIKYCSGIFYVLAFFSHTNTVFFGLFFLIKFFKKQLTLKELSVLAIVGILSTAVVSIYPVLYFGSLRTFLNWVFMSPQYYPPDIWKNIILIIVLFGPTSIWFITTFKKPLSANFELLAPICIGLGIYSLTPTNGYYIDSILSWLPIAIILSVNSIQFLYSNYKKTVYVGLLLISLVNFITFSSLFNIKQQFLHTTIQTIQDNTAETAYIYDPFLMPHLDYFLPEKIIVSDINWDKQSITLFKTLRERRTEKKQKIPFSELHFPLYAIAYPNKSVPKNIGYHIKNIKNNHNFFIWRFIKRPKSWAKSSQLYEIKRPQSEN